MKLGSRLCAVAALSVLALASCKNGTSRQATLRRAATAQCSGTDTHTRHINAGFACSTCHPRGGEYAAGGTTPGGTPVTGTITVGSPTTCAVSCHGGQTVAWNDTNLSCVSCHTGAFLTGARSAHVTSSDRAACVACHDMSAHTSGTVKMVVGDGTPGNPACLACHSGNGKGIDGKVPPIVVEFGAGGADAHGDGGAEPALTCASCHDQHASTSTFLLGRRSDPAPLPDNAIASRAGIGAEALCHRCHATRHQSCLVTCHAHSPGGHLTDPVPNGGACFACHGHEGIVRGDEVVEGELPTYWGFFLPTGCMHCHDTNLPPVETTPPDVTNPVFSNDGVATATVTWTSREPANSWVEYAEAGSTVTRLAGNAQFRLDHSVQLTGLAVGLAYDVRIRTSDRMRNVAYGTRESVTLGAPSTPVPTAVSDNMFACTSIVPVTLRWSASSDPNGDPLVYEVQVSTATGFETLVVSDVTPPGATSYTTNLPATSVMKAYFWRVRARDPQGLLSSWSSVDSFLLRFYCE